MKHLKPIGGEKSKVSSSVEPEMMGDVLFTVTAPNMRIDVDNALKIELVETLIKHAKNQLGLKAEPSATGSENDSDHTKEGKDGIPPV